jgi:hypothetical protein
MQKIGHEPIEVNDSFERFQESELLSPVQSNFQNAFLRGEGTPQPISEYISQTYDAEQPPNDQMDNLIRRAELGNKKLNLFFDGT